MDDIARKAGISKKTLYQHFANKSEVVMEMVGWYQQNVAEACIKGFEGSANAIEGMIKVMVIFDDVLSNTNPVALYELERFYPDAFKRFREHIINNDVEIIKGVINKGIDDGLFRTNVDAEFAARFRLELTFMTLKPNFFIPTRQQISKLAEDVAEHFLYGIMTPKGEKLYHKYKEQYSKKVTIL